ncbi:MAG: hypothetical protein ABH884_02280 [Candidatus Komeilibacteria bacterium]
MFETADGYDGMIIGLKTVGKSCAEVIATYQKVMISLKRVPRYESFVKALLHHYPIDEVKECFHHCPGLSETQIDNLAKK